MLAEESPAIITSMREMVREEIQSSLKNLCQAPDLPSTSSVVRGSSSEGELGLWSSERVEQDSDFSSSDESCNDPSFPSEEVDRLIKEVRATMALEEPKEEKSIEDKMFEGLDSRKKRVFPIHKNVWGLIHREWRHPDKGIFNQRILKRKYPFCEQDTAAWNRPPKLDVPIAKISRRSSLPFEDSGALLDPLDKKQDLFLKKAWEASAGGFKPNIAATCVARSLLVWLEQLEEHIRNKTPRDTLLASLPTLKNAASFLADASTDALRLSAKGAALANSARRALWLKNWSGDIGSKSRLCAIPCEGDYLFGSVLDDLLEKAGDKGKGFPTTFPFTLPNRQTRPFRGQGRLGDRRRQDSQRARNPRKTRGFLYNQRKSGPF